MEHRVKKFLFGNTNYKPIQYDIGFLILRFFVGLALCTVFEKFMPRDGIWGPQEWFIQDVANMGFPLPAFFAWTAILAEFFGGILLMMGLLTRPMAILNACVTFVATFIYHNGDIGNSGLMPFFFFIMCVCIALFGGGKFSLDFLVTRRIFKVNPKLLSILFLCTIGYSGQAQSTSNFPNVKSISTTVNDSTNIDFFVKNNSLVPKKVIFISYSPNKEGNQTLVKWFLPFQKKTMSFPIGSKIYIATSEQIETVMDGKSITNEEPFITVAVDLRMKHINLKNRHK